MLRYVVVLLRVARSLTIPASLMARSTSGLVLEALGVDLHVVVLRVHEMLVAQVLVVLVHEVVVPHLDLRLQRGRLGRGQVRVLCVRRRANG